MNTKLRMMVNAALSASRSARWQFARDGARVREIIPAKQQIRRRESFDLNTG